MQVEEITMEIRIFRSRAGRGVAVAICGLALSTVSLLAQNNSGTAQQAPQEEHAGAPGGSRGGPAKGGEMRLERMTKALNLSPDQTSQIKAIDQDSMTQMKALRDDTGTDKADKRFKMMSIHDASNTKIRALLNDEQKTKFDAMEARMRQRMQNRRGGDQGAPPPSPSNQ